MQHNEQVLIRDVGSFTERKKRSIGVFRICSPKVALGNQSATPHSDPFFFRFGFFFRGGLNTLTLGMCNPRLGLAYNLKVSAKIHGSIADKQ